MKPIYSGGLLLLAPFVLAEPQKVTDFRIAPDVSRYHVTYFDYGYGPDLTRPVEGAPVQLPTTFSVTSADASIGAGDPTTDPRLTSFTVSTRITQLNRFETAANPEPGAETVGAMQMSLDLSNLDQYLAENSGLSLDSLDVRLILDLGDEEKPYDVYLSYTNAEESISHTNISRISGQDNFQNFWNPAHLEPLPEVGDIVGGTHKILNYDQTGDLDQAVDLLSLYSSGVREVNVIVTTASFFSNRTIFLLEGGGVFADFGSGPVQLSDLRLKQGIFAGEVAADVHGPFPTRAVDPAPPVEIGSTLLVVTQNFGGVTPFNNVAMLNLDGIAEGTNTTGGTTATVTGYGEDWISELPFDGFQYTAWKENGDFDVTIQLDSLDADDDARAGFMVRSSSEGDASHAFIGVQGSGDVLIVFRNEEGDDAVEQFHGTVTLHQRFRIVRFGDELELYLPDAEDGDLPIEVVEIALEDSMFVGAAVTSGSNQEEAVGEFSELPFLPDVTKDVGITNPDDELVNLVTLNRFEGLGGGMPQWLVDLSPLDDYLADNQVGATSLNLKIAFANSDASKPFDFYLSYTNGITLTPISNDSPAANKLNFFDPSRGAEPGEIINGTHKVIAIDELVEANFAAYDLTVDLLPLYQAGVREFALSMATDDYYAGRIIQLDGESGVFLDTEPGSAVPEVSSIDASGGQVSLSLAGLASGSLYHLVFSSDLETAFSAVTGSQFTAEGEIQTVSTPIQGAKGFLRVVTGAAP